MIISKPSRLRIPDTGCATAAIARYRTRRLFFSQQQKQVGQCQRAKCKLLAARSMCRARKHLISVSITYVAGNSFGKCTNLELVFADVALHAVQLDDDVQLVHVAGAVRQADLRADVGRLLALALLIVFALGLQATGSNQLSGLFVKRKAGNAGPVCTQIKTRPDPEGSYVRRVSVLASLPSRGYSRLLVEKRGGSDGFTEQIPLVRCAHLLLPTAVPRVLRRRRCLRGLRRAPPREGRLGLCRRGHGCKGARFLRGGLLDRADVGARNDPRSALLLVALVHDRRRRRIGAAHARLQPHRPAAVPPKLRKSSVTVGFSASDLSSCVHSTSSE